MDPLAQLAPLVRAALPLADRLFDCHDVDLAMAEDAVRLATRLKTGISHATAQTAADLFGMLVFGAGEFSADEMSTITEGLFLASMISETATAAA